MALAKPTGCTTPALLVAVLLTFACAASSATVLQTEDTNKQTDNGSNTCTEAIDVIEAASEKLQGYRADIEAESLMTVKQLLVTLCMPVTERASSPSSVGEEAHGGHVSTRQRQLTPGTTNAQQLCTYQHLLQGLCLSRSHHSTHLVISSTASDRPPPSWKTQNATANLQKVSTRITSLRINGTVREDTLQWLLQHGNWTRVSSAAVLGLQHRSFDMASLASFTNLTSLNLTHNQLYSLFDSRQPANITATGMVGVPASTHALGSLPGALLRALDVSYNALRSVPSAVLATMPSLTHLDLSGNMVTELGCNAFAAQTRLYRLWLAESRITAIHERVFHSLSHLTDLQLNGNDIFALHPKTLQPLSRLEQLLLNFNPIQTLHPDTFHALTRATNLILENMRLTSLPAGIFSKMTSLQVLDLSNNQLQNLHNGIFHGLSLLRGLSIAGNELKQVPADLFRGLGSLQTLSVGGNRLETLPGKLLADCHSLLVLHVQRNKLRCVPADLLRTTSKLHGFEANGNAITAIDPHLFAGLTALDNIDLSNNALTTFASSVLLPNLTLLDLSNNGLTTLPDLRAVPKLCIARFGNHHIPSLDLSMLLQLPLLRIVDLDAHPRMKCKAFIPQDTLQRLTQFGGDVMNLTTLDTLHLSDVELPQALLTFLLQQCNLSLSNVRLGWPGLNEGVLPIEALCSMLAPRVHELGLVHTGYTRVSLCPDIDFLNLVLLHEDTALKSFTMFDNVGQLNVSGCSQLEELKAPGADILDISGTRVRPSTSLCGELGGSMLFARGLSSEGYADPAAFQQLLKRCLTTVDVLDLSAVPWIDNPAAIGAVAGTPIVLSSKTFSTYEGLLVPSRSTVPLLQLQATSVQCALRLTQVLVPPSSDPTELSSEVAYFFECECASGYHLHDGTRCVRNTVNIALYASVSAVGGALLVVLLLLAQRWWVHTRRYRVRLEEENALSRHLLVQRSEEVQALKEGWRIDFSELQFERRLASGAFGTVYSAEWDTLTVAVKVLEKNVMLFDEQTVTEFEKEVEFLQRTRHPHLVRFFGAGTAPSGSPFLVLEYVGLGALRDLVRGNGRLQEILREFGHKAARDKAAGPKTGAEAKAGADAEALEEGTTTSSSSADERTALLATPSALSTRKSRPPRHDRHKTTTAWELKLQLLRDVANGMAFVHRLGHVHRDLKSGNVLVSTNLHAKITDFGSIRQCLCKQKPSSEARGRNACHQGSSLDAAKASPTADTQYCGNTCDGAVQLTLTMGVGTPLYMAPEVLTSGRYDAKADVFSFGVLLWEVAMERSPDLIAQEKGSTFRGPMLSSLATLLDSGKRLAYHGAVDGDSNGADDNFCRAAQALIPPAWYKSLTMECMSQDPAQRPRFQELLEWRLSRAGE